MTSGQEMEWVYSYNPGAHMGLLPTKHTVEVQGRTEQGCSPRGICLCSRRPRGSFFSWLGLASAVHGLASVSTWLPQLCLIVSASSLGSVWKVAPCLGSVVISHQSSAHGAQVQV